MIFFNQDVKLTEVIDKKILLSFFQWRKFKVRKTQSFQNTFFLSESDDHLSLLPLKQNQKNALKCAGEQIKKIQAFNASRRTPGALAHVAGRLKTASKSSQQQAWKHQQVYVQSICRVLESSRLFRESFPRVT